MFKLDLTKAEEGATTMLESLGMDLTDANYKDTPKRLVEVFYDFTCALRDDCKGEIDEYFSAVFPKHKDCSSDYKGMLVQSPIRVYSLCSHHLLPVIYDIAFAYIPKDGRQIGFSKIVRILRHIAKRPMNQENFTQEAVELFYNKLQPKGLALVISGVHLCMKMRGVQCEAVNKTSAVRGDFKDYERTRDEFLALVANFNHPL